MNKLRENLLEAWSKSDSLQQCEQINDDFSVKLLVWLATEATDDMLIDKNSSIQEHAEQLQQYFKENVYGKE